MSVTLSICAFILFFCNLCRVWGCVISADRSCFLSVVWVNVRGLRCDSFLLPPTLMHTRRCSLTGSDTDNSLHRFHWRAHTSFCTGDSPDLHTHSELVLRQQPGSVSASSRFFINMLTNTQTHNGPKRTDGSMRRSGPSMSLLLQSLDANRHFIIYYMQEVVCATWQFLYWYDAAAADTQESCFDPSHLRKNVEILEVKE